MKEKYSDGIEWNTYEKIAEGTSGVVCRVNADSDCDG